MAKTPLADIASADTPTPENTPLPGGGSWRWDATLPGWALNAPYEPMPAATSAAPEQTLE